MRRQRVLQAEAPPLPFQPRPSSDTERSHIQKGELFLECAKRNGKTVFTRSRCSYPWYFFQPLYLDHTGCATTFLTNPSGGLAGGDTCSLLATLGKDSHVLFTTPSATKVYRTLQEPAVQSIDLNVEANANCEWIPELTIPFAGSSFEQTVTVRLETGASLILWDALAADGSFVENGGSFPLMQTGSGSCLQTGDPLKSDIAFHRTTTIPVSRSTRHGITRDRSSS